MSSPCHIEMFLVEKDEAVPKADEETAQKKKVSQKKLKRQKLKAALSGAWINTLQELYLQPIVVMNFYSATKCDWSTRKPRPLDAHTQVSLHHT